MRLFIAAYPPPSVLADFVSHVSTLAVGAPRGPGRSLRLVPPERVHLTLVFLGDVPDERQATVEAAVGAGVRRWTRDVRADDGRRRQGPEIRRRDVPAVRVAGSGRFGRDRSTTVWAGVRGDTTELAEVVTGLRQEFRAAGLPFDAKAFRPHVTVARPGDRLPPADLAADLAALAAYEGPEWRVDAIDLVRSTLGPDITYDRLAAFPLR